MKRHSYGFKTFVAVRLGEIQETFDTDSWYWINGCNNIADWITGGKNPEELDERAYTSLSRLEIEKEMSNTITLSIIEERLPGNIGRERSKEVNREGNKVDRFNKFLFFVPIKSP